MNTKTAMESGEQAIPGAVLSDEIAGMKARLVLIQDQFMAALNADESTEDDLAEVAEALSWALSTESILSSLRVELLQTGKDHTNALDLVSVVRKQIAETEETLNRGAEV